MHTQSSSTSRSQASRSAPSLSTLLLLSLVMWLTLLMGGCTLHHSKQALAAGDEPPPAPNATFIQEEDSGVSLLGFVEIAEPDHYAVLLERARRRYKCGRIHHAQLDFFTDHWLLIAFPISRITAICDPPQGNTGEAPQKP